MVPIVLTLGVCAQAAETPDFSCSCPAVEAPDPQALAKAVQIERKVRDVLSDLPKKLTFVSMAVFALNSAMLNDLAVADDDLSKAHSLRIEAYRSETSPGLLPELDLQEQLDRRLRKPELAQAVAQTAWKIMEGSSCKSRASLAACRVNLAAALESGGLVDEAGRQYRSALDEAGEEQPARAEVVLRYAAYLAAQNDVEGAVVELQAVSLIPDSSATRESILEARLNLGDLFAVRPDIGSAAEQYRAAYRLFDAPAVSPSPASIAILGRLSDASLSNAQFPEAIAFLRRALEFSKREYGPNSKEAAKALYWLGSALRRAGQLDEARSALTESLGEMENLYGRGLEPARPEAELAMVETRSNLAQACQRAISAGKRVNLYQSIMVIPFPVPLGRLDELYPYFNAVSSALMSACQAKGEFPRAYELIPVNKSYISYALTKQLSFFRNANDPSSVGQRLITARERMASAFTQAYETHRDDFRIGFDQGLLAENRAEADASESVAMGQYLKKALRATGKMASDPRAYIPFLKRHGDLSDFDPLANHNAVQNGLQPEEVLWDIYLYQSAVGTEAGRLHYCAAVVRKDSKPEFNDLGDAQEVDDAIRGWRQAVLERAPADAAWGLISKSWAKLREASGKEIRRILVSPDGEFNQIPWQLFEEPGSIEVTSVEAPRSFLLSRKKKRTASNSEVLLVGDANLKSTEGDSIRNTALEIQRIHELAPREFSAILLTREKAVKDSVLRELPNATYAHFATHGMLIRDEPAPGSNQRQEVYRDLISAGLALSGADEVNPNSERLQSSLNAYEMARLDLSKTVLVTLSACRSGLGESINGQGMLGFRTSLMSAGVKSLLISLWDVPDLETRTLMEEFYSLVWKDHRSLPEALRLAQQDLAKSYPTEPFYWAGWTLVGDPW